MRQRRARQQYGVRQLPAGAQTSRRTDTGIVLRVLRDTASVQKLCQRDSRQARFRPSRSRAHCTSARPRYLSQTFSTWRTVPRAMRRWPRSRPTLRSHYAHTTPEPRPGTTTRAEPGPHYAHTTPTLRLNHGRGLRLRCVSMLRTRINKTYVVWARFSI